MDKTDTALSALIALSETNGRIRWLLNALIEGTIDSKWAKQRLDEIDQENQAIRAAREKNT